MKVASHALCAVLLTGTWWVSAAPPAQAVGPTAVTCYAGEELRLTGDADVTVGPGATRCGRVVLVAEGATVRLPDATQVDVIGSGNDLIGTGDGLGIVNVHGNGTDIRATRITGLYITGDGNIVNAERGGFAGAQGRRNVLRYGQVETLVLRGSRNIARSGDCGATRVQGDRNDVVHQRLRVLLLSGDHNYVKVRQGRVKASVSGTGNVLRLHRR